MFWIMLSLDIAGLMKVSCYEVQVRSLAVEKKQCSKEQVKIVTEQINCQSVNILLR